MAKVIIETSARHVHLSKADVEALFGAGHQLTNKKDLSQPGQFACAEKVTIVGPKGTMNASVLGPERPVSQVEISLTDARSIGVTALVRESGDIAGTHGCKLVGPNGEVELKEGVVAAKRHMHTTPSDAATMGVVDKTTISLKVETNGRALTFSDVVVRVSENFVTRVHIDTDEANAAAITGEIEAEVIA